MFELKANFTKKYSDNIKCSIKDCDMDESQEHLMTTCKPLLSHLKNRKTNVKYNDIFLSPRKQKEATRLFSELLEIRSNQFNL